MPFKVSDEEKPKFNKRVQESFTLLSEQLEDIAFQGAASEEPAIELDSIRDADGNIISNSLDLFSTPLNGDKSKALGLVDADGNATDKGELFFNMKEAGMFDDTGVITDKGKAYLMKPIDIKDPKNLPAFTQLWDDGVIRGDETTWGQKGEALMGFGGNILGGIGEMGSNFGKNLYYQLDNRKGFGIPFLRSEENDNTPEWLKAENVAIDISVGEKIATNLMEMGRMADIAGNWVADKMMDPAYWGQNETPAKEDSKALYASRQRQWAMRETLKDLEVGEVAEMITEVKGIVDEAEKAKEVIGEERFKKIVERTGATTEMFGSPENLIPASFALNLGKLVPLGNRASIGAQKVLSKVLIKEAEIGALETSLEAAKLTVEKGAISNRLTSRFIEEGATIGATPVAISRGEKAAEIAARTAKITDEATAAIPVLTSNLDEAVKLRNSLSTRIPETAANATLKTLEAGRQLRGLPAKAIGGALEGFGNTLTKIDGSVSNFLKERGLDQMYSAALGAAGVVGVAGSPVIGTIGAGAAALKAGKMITNYGKLFKYVGKEMVKVKGQIPFWKRVAAHTEAGSLNRAIAHTFNMLDLGGATSDTLRRIPRGIAAAAPSDLMFEWLSDGADMRPETLYQALAESVYIGGSFAAAGGAFMGTKTRMRQLAIGDQLNFNQGLTDTRQKVLYNQLDPGTRNSIATYSIANPTLNYVFKDNGASNYDPNTNTATINVNSNNSIKPLIAHETLHHTLIKNNMEAGISALFLGDTVNNTVGGLLRSKDGKLDPNFKAFTDAYYQRLNIAGMTDAEKNAIYPLDKMAVEYFIEQHSDQYAGMAESGELGAIAASGDIKRKLSGVLETVLPRIPVLRDLHFKSGGMIDKDGGWVTGNGILDAGGVKTNPITNKMFRDMNRRSSGLAPGQFEPLVSDKQDSGAQLSLDPSNPIDSELLHPLVKVDENGSPVLVDGKPVALDKVTLLQRALAGLTAKEVMSRKKAENYIPEKGEAHVDDAGEFQPGWLSNDILAEMFAKNSFNPEQKRIIREMNRMIRKGDGGRAVMINFPATTRNKAGKVVYKAQGATLRDTVPVAITISKDGNLVFGLMSVNKLQENIQKRSRSRLGKKLYGGNVDLILRDTQAMMQFHKDGVDSIEYFKEKYGAVEADERKKFINTMFGLLNQKEQAVLNPMLIEDGVKSRDNVYRTYRADRVSKAVAMSPDDYPAMPFSYEAVSQVKMPEQSRQMPEEPITSSSERWKSMSNKEKDAYVFTPAEMTPSNRAEFDARVESGSLSVDTPVVDINRSNLLTSKYGPPSSSATGNINTWIDDNTGKPVAVAFSENGNIPTKGEQNQTPRYMPEKVDADYMKAVESGDVEAQQRAVDEAAKAAGYKFQAKHGTPEKKLFTEFGERGKLTGAKSAEKAFFFSDSEALTDTYRMQNRKEPDETLINDWVDGLSDTQISKLLPRDYRLPMDTPFMIEYARDTIKEQGLDFMNEMGEDIYYGLDELVSKAKSNKIPFPKEFDPKDIGNTYNVKLRIDDPYYFTYDQYEVSGMDGIVKQAIEKGHDGIISKDKISDAFSGWDNKTPPSGIIYAVFDPEQIKSTDPITRDDSGNIIPPSKRFNTESKDIRYMPEPMKKPYGPNDPLPSFESTVVRGETKKKGFKWDKATNVVYDIGDGKTMSFSFDPAYLVEPKFGDPEKLLKGQAVIMLEADKARATGGDMGGVNHVNLRSNHVSVTGPDGIKYRVKWANMSSAFISGSKNRMQAHGAKYAVIQLMDDFALKSNKRTARTLDGAMREADLTTDQNTMIAMAMKYGIIVGKKAKLSSTATALARELADATPEEKIIISSKIKSTLAERDALNPPPDEMEVFKAISNIKTAMSNVATGRWKQATVDRAFSNLESLKSGDAYNRIASKIQSPYIYDNIGNTFTDRGAAVGSITSVKLGSFDVKRIILDSSDFKEAKNLDIVSAVELSQNPDFFALYFGKDPIQEAAMSPSERAARDQMLADNDFQVHESYDWAMIGPVDGNDFIFNKPVRPETIFKNYRSVHEKASVKSGSEETVAGAMRKSAEYKLTAYGDTVKMTSNKKTSKVKK